MDLFDAIYARKSVRSFTPKIIENESLIQLVRAAMAAPSACDIRPWEFILVTKRQTLDKLANIMPYGKMLHNAPAAIIVCADLLKAKEAPQQEYWIQDCSAATQNILLASVAFGFGAVWLGVTPTADRITQVASCLKLPKNVQPLNIIAVGYPATDEPSKDKFNPNQIHLETW